MKTTDTMRAARAFASRKGGTPAQLPLGSRFAMRGIAEEVVPVTLIPARFQPAAPAMPAPVPEPIRHAAWDAFGR